MAFTASVNVPNELTLTAPTCSAGDCGSVRRNSDLHVTWTGAVSSGVVLGFNSGKITAGVVEKLVTVSCRLTSSPAVADRSRWLEAGAGLTSQHHRITVSIMRTTVTLEDDVYEAAMTLVKTTRRSLGQVISELARRGLKPVRPTRGRLPGFAVSANAPIIPGDRASKLLADEEP